MLEVDSYISLMLTVGHFKAAKHKRKCVERACYWSTARMCVPGHSMLQCALQGLELRFKILSKGYTTASVLVDVAVRCSAVILVHCWANGA